MSIYFSLFLTFKIISMGYSISWETWKGLDGAREFMYVRRANLKHTNIFWLTTGWEIDLDMSDGVWFKRSPILIWLN